MRERMVAVGCMAAALAAAWVGWDQLGIHALTQHVPQRYGPGHVTLAFIGAVVIWLCVHAAALARRAGTLAAVHGAGLALALGSFTYLHWPQNGDDVGYFAYLTDTESHWGRDVLLLAVALVAGFALPTAVAVRRRRRAEP